MTVLTPDLVPAEASTITDDLCHIVCQDCYPDGNGPSMCGQSPATGQGWDCPGPGQCGEPDCIVCDELGDQLCVRCGR